MRYYNNLRKFEELKSFKRFYAEDPIPLIDVVVYHFVLNIKKV